MAKIGLKRYFSPQFHKWSALSKLIGPCVAVANVMAFKLVMKSAVISISAEAVHV